MNEGIGARFNFAKDKSGHIAGYLALQEGTIAQQFPQSENRVLDFGVDGKLLGIEFLNASVIDLTNLPQDEIIPTQNLLVGVLAINGFNTITELEEPVGGQTVFTAPTS